MLFQFYTDANEAESWLNERVALAASNDFGEDEPSAQSLLQRHRDLEGELRAYSGDIQSLNGQAEKLIKAGISTIKVSFYTARIAINSFLFTKATLQFLSGFKWGHYSNIIPPNVYL